MPKEAGLNPEERGAGRWLARQDKTRQVVGGFFQVSSEADGCPAEGSLLGRLGQPGAWGAVGYLETHSKEQLGVEYLSAARHNPSCASQPSLTRCSSAAPGGTSSILYVKGRDISALVFFA